ncbi:hypothetical protein AV654_06255 [Paenibacillus elgii]|uniref:YfhO family protein n=2 Tax=Paenibacillus elgii TaxID=189691 RepID=A0A161TTN1_9BACL|nr:hypothetical protein AV654_06255 [Paenibacillus elgii]
MFNQFSLPLKQILILFFPYLFGGIDQSIYGAGYFGLWSPTEISGYVGWLPIIFAAVIVLSKQIIRNKYVLFWSITALFSFILMLGDGTFLSKIMYHVPGYNLFRAPGRNLVEYSFAISVLGALGLKYFIDSNIKIRLVLQWLIPFTIILVSIILFNYNDLIKKAKEKGVIIDTFPFANLSITIPLLFIFLSIGIIFILKIKARRIALILCLLVLVFDLSSFGWFYEWRFFAPSINSIQKTEDQNQSRIVAPEGFSLPALSLRPNINQISNLKSINGYNPLILKKYKQFVGMETSGVIDMNQWNNQVIDLLSGKFIYVSKNNSKVSNSMLFNDTSLQLNLSKDKKTNITFNINDFKGDQIGFVSKLSYSIPLKDNTEIAKINIKYSDNSVETKPIIVGKDVSEWAYDRSDVKSAVQHSRAQVFKSFTLKDSTLGIYEGHSYISIHQLTPNKSISSINIEMSNIPDVNLEIDQISLFNSKDKLSYLVASTDSLFTDSTRWIKKDVLESEIIQYENKKVLPMVWSPETVKHFEDDEILGIIKKGVLPDGKLVDLKSVAFLSENNNFNGITKNTNLELVSESSGLRVIKSDHLTPSFVVFSNINYPGWKAYIDGKETKIYETNYILQGIYVPEGTHIIEFKFEPFSFKLGVICFFIGILLMLSYIVFLNYQKRKEFTKDGSN